MNFSFIALTMALATASAAPVARKNFKLNGTRNLRKDSPLTKALMKNARPYKAANGTSRKLEENGFDGSYNFKFDKCVDIKTYDEGNFENYADAITAGTVVPTKSFVIFHVCTDATCDYDSEDDLYIVDLPTYLGTVATFHAQGKANYCEACQEFADTCAVEEEEEEVEEDADAEEADAEAEAEDEPEEDEPEEEEEERAEEENREEENREGEEQEGDGRKLKKTRRTKQTQRRTKQAIDCDQCQAYECYAEQEEGADDLDEQAAEWIKGVAECAQAEIQYNGADVFYGAMCDDYGDGVELAVFLDDKCSLYSKDIAFNQIYYKEEGNDAYNYLTYAENYIKKAFANEMSCLAVEYYDPNEEQNEDEEERYEMNGYCQQVLKNNAYDYTQCEEDEDAQQLYTEDGTYAYDVEYNNNLKAEAVCAVIKRMENAGDYYHAYDASSSGTWYKRDKHGKIVVESQKGSSGLSGGAIFGIIAAIAVVIGGAAFAVMKKKQKKGDIAESAEYQGGALS